MKKLPPNQREAIEKMTIAVMLTEQLMRNCATRGVTVSVYQNGGSLAPIFTIEGRRQPVPPVYFTKRTGMMALRDAAREILQTAEEILAAPKRPETHGVRKGHRL